MASGGQSPVNHSITPDHMESGGQTDTLQNGDRQTKTHDITGIIMDCVDDGEQRHSEAEHTGTPGYPILVRVKSPEVRSQPLHKYFQSKKSGGGECDVELKDDIYRVTFKKASDKRSVLSKTTHTIKIKHMFLKLEVKSQSQLTTETSADQSPPRKGSVEKQNVQENATLDKITEEENLLQKSDVGSDRDVATGVSAPPATPQQAMECDPNTDTNNPNQQPGEPAQQTQDRSTREGTQCLGATCVPGAGDPQRGEGFPDDSMNRGEAASFKTQGSWSESVNTEPRADTEPDTALHTSPEKKGDQQQKMECDPSTDTSNPNQQRGERPAQRTQPGNTREIFSHLKATLDRRRYSLEQIHEALSVSPSLRVIHQSSEEVEVTGSFTAVEILYRYLEGKEGRGEEAPPQHQENVISLPASLYQYFWDVHSADIKAIKDQCKVDVDQHNDSTGNTVLTFTPRGPDCHTEKAKQLFTDKIQSIMSSDWTQRDANLPDASTLSITDIRQRVRERFHQTLVITEGDKVILRGPGKEVAAAQRYLEQGTFSSSPSRRAVTIVNQGMADYLSVSASHLDSVKKLRSRDIRELEEKYSVKMEESRGGDQVRVSFRAMGGPPDLGPHALQMFLSLVQRTISTAAVMENASLDSGKGNHHQRNNEQQPEGASGGSKRPYAASDMSRNAPPGGSRSPDRGASKDAEEPMDTSDSSSSANNKRPDAEDEKCPICLDFFTGKTILEKCKHEFCKKCIEKCLELKPLCPICSTRYGVVRGNQPDGTMTDTVIRSSLPGYHCRTIKIDYHFSNGTQGGNHPSPGRPYQGTHRTAYLPDDTEGQEILQLLKKAFNQKLVFTVGESRTTGTKDCVTWNDIHHKTNTYGGPGNFGYPDPQYLKRVRDELKAKGIE